MPQKAYRLPGREAREARANPCGKSARPVAATSRAANPTRSKVRSQAYAASRGRWRAARSSLRVDRSRPSARVVPDEWSPRPTWRRGGRTEPGLWPPATRTLTVPEHSLDAAGLHAACRDAVAPALSGGSPAARPRPGLSAFATLAVDSRAARCAWCASTVDNPCHPVDEMALAVDERSPLCTNSRPVPVASADSCTGRSA